MGVSKNIVHLYFRKESDGQKILIRFNPLTRLGTQLTLAPGHEPGWADVSFDGDPSEIDSTFAAAGFQPASPFEYQLYAAGLARD